MFTGSWLLFLWTSGCTHCSKMVTCYSSTSASQNSWNYHYYSQKFFITQLLYVEAPNTTRCLVANSAFITELNSNTMKISLNQRAVVTVKRMQKRLSAPALFTIFLLLLVLHATPKFFKSQDFLTYSQESQNSKNTNFLAKTRKVLILSSYRSGSSLMGELVASTSQRLELCFEDQAKCWDSSSTTYTFCRKNAENKKIGTEMFSGTSVINRGSSLPAE